jgi:hypothetical protein
MIFALINADQLVCTRIQQIRFHDTAKLKLTKIQSRRSCRQHDYGNARGPRAPVCGLSPWTPSITTIFCQNREIYNKAKELI